MLLLCWCVNMNESNLLAAPPQHRPRPSLPCCCQPKQRAQRMRYAVAVTAATFGATADRKEPPPRREHAYHKQLCLINGTISSLRAAGWRGDIVCQTSGLDLTAQLATLCTHVLNLSVPRFDAGPVTDTSATFVEWMLQKKRVVPAWVRPQSLSRRPLHFADHCWFEAQTEAAPRQVGCAVQLAWQWRAHRRQDARMAPHPV